MLTVSTSLPPTPYGVRDRQTLGAVYRFAEAVLIEARIIESEEIAEAIHRLDESLALYGVGFDLAP